MVSGATGLIGSALVTHLRQQGHTVRRLVRRQRGERPGEIPWDPERGTLDARAIEGCDAIVHLAGAPISQRWTASHKHAIRESRVRGTATMARAVAEMESKPRVVLSGSAMGFYGDRGDELLDENSSAGSGFLASVVRDWEAAAAPIATLGVRLVLLRTGLVLSPDGGALAKLLPPFKLGAGGPMGGGKQWMSWISLADHVRAMEYAIVTDGVHGPVNLASPAPVTNETFAHVLGRVLSRPAIIPLPAFALELMFGEMARETILAGQRLTPRALTTAGFRFEHPDLEPALRDLLAH